MVDAWSDTAASVHWRARLRLLTPSGIDRQLGRPNAVLGMALVQPLERRQVFGVLLLIEVLKCRYHCRSFDLFPHGTRSQAKSFV
jgi:hypothetical protein